MSEIDFDKRRREMEDDTTSEMVIERLLDDDSPKTKLVVIWIDGDTKEIRSYAASGEFKNTFELVGLLEHEKLRRMDDTYEE